MNTKLVNHAADVICRAMETGRHTPASWAMALESAQLLQSPEKAAELIALRNDALNMRGALSPNGFPRRVPMPLGKELAPVVEWLLNRVDELEQQLAAKDRPADEDPIAYALTDKASAPVSAPQREASPRHERLRDLLAAQRAMVLEDQHDSPLHHDYRVPRDLPEAQR
ncbi:hypothetical protein [Streptomyces sp. NPDC057623]|uniref:hypothetical protein n=1 Tax=Streptomyces sp. NPDC057623 TaxID=3346187 RepID=UPI00369C5CCC